MAKELPVIVLKNFVIFPKQTLRIDVGNTSIETVILSENEYDSELIIVSPNDILEENPSVEDLPLCAVIVKMIKKIVLSEGITRVTLEGVQRVKIKEYFNEKDALKCRFLHFEIPKVEKKEEIAYRKELMKFAQKYVENNHQINVQIEKMKNYNFSDFVDYLTSILSNDIDKSRYIKELDPLERAKMLIEDLAIELRALQIDETVVTAIEQGLQNNHEDYVMREKIKRYKMMLGEKNQKTLEIEEYYEQLKNLKLPSSTQKKIEKEIKKYEFLTDTSPDVSFVRNYLELFFSLPWNEQDESVECDDLKQIEKILNKSHYGLKKVKERILEYAAMKKRNPLLQSPIICLVGPPGVGKSTIASSIADALHRKFCKISVGGLNDSAELIGHRRTYLGSAPGRIVNALQKCGTRNPLILIDEVDKMVKDYKGDPASVLLDILDPNLNQSFVDQYLEEPIDLSHVFFLLTANRLDDIPLELKDRLEIIEISSYSTLEKIKLATNYILPLLRLDYHVEDSELQIPENVLQYLILNYTNEAGVRDLRRRLEEIYRKSILNSEKNKKNLASSLEIKDIRQILEEKRTIADLEPKLHTYGLVKCLAVTELGGLVLPIESSMFPGTGKVHFTGSLGEVMKESMDVVISFLKAHSDVFEIDPLIFTTKDIHIHALDGATLKDGPSAGVAITTSLISLFTQKKVPLDISMTGEMSLRGEVLQVGKMKEKIIGAYNRGVKKVFIPESNKTDLKTISKEIVSSIEIVYVKEYLEIFNQIFVNNVSNK